MAPQPEDVDLAVLKRLNREGRGMTRDAIGGQRAYFVRHRCEQLVSSLPNLTLDQMVGRVLNEHEKLRRFIAGIVDAGRRGTDGSPPQLDLHDLARAKPGLPASVVRHAEVHFKYRRWYRIAGIAWRAAAVAELWRDVDAGLMGDLDESALLELVHRRLRFVERMNLQVGRLDRDGQSWHFTGGGTFGPWYDGFRVRMLEEPWIPDDPKTAAHEIETFLGGPANVAPFAAGVFPWTPGDPEWRWDWNEKGLDYWRELVRLGPNMPEWEIDPTNPRALDSVILSGAGARLADALDAAMQYDRDWWQRSWLLPPMTIDLLEWEALSFAFQRRYRDGRARVDALGASAIGPSGFFSLGGSLPPDVFTRVDDEFASDLQIGDQVIMFNHHVFELIYRARGTLAIVTDVTSPPDGLYDLSSMKFQSPGTREYRYDTFLRRVVAPEFNRALETPRQHIDYNLGISPGETVLSWHGQPELLMRWDPYETLGGGGAWWVRIVAGTVVPDPSLVAGAIFVDKIDKAPDFRPPPLPADAYFPLHVPKGYDGWNGYFKRRKADVQHRTPPALAPFRADGSIIPGIYRQGRPFFISVLRPKARPS